MRKIWLTLGLALAFSSLVLSAGKASRSEQISLAMDLFDHGLFYEAARQFSEIARQEDDDEARGYAILCRVTLRAGGYEEEMDAYLDAFPAMPVSYKIIYRYALNRFDDEDYAVALRYFNRLRLDNLERSQYSEFCFKQAYCHFELGDYPRAAEGFRWTLELPRSDYYAPSWYALGYMDYQEKNFKNAFNAFSQAARDPRFQANSVYYMMECKFMTGEYDYLVEEEEKAFKIVPEERKMRLARMLSEIYLVWQNPEKAQEYYDQYLVRQIPKTRKDYFYVGSLLYAVQDYEGAVEHFMGMTYRADSLGQIANYQMADCQLHLKNKVAAMEAFKEAAAVDFDARITEDAHFNYAKLAFDLNEDGEGFRSYLRKYSDSVRGEQIYSYMALSYLQDKHYDLAIEYYDKIDEFDETMKENYMKANYLRGAELLSDGSYRLAMNHFRWASVYAEKGSRISQYADFYLADACYRDGKYERARKLYTDLYHASALQGTPQHSLIGYGLAYCWFREQDYAQADRWFARYDAEKDAPYRKNAVIRRGDCHFLRGDYASALTFYRQAVALEPDINDIYPYYQAGLCCGLLSDPSARIEALVPVSEASPESPYYGEALYELGLAYVDAKRNDDAVRTFTMLVEKDRDTTYVSKSLLALGMLSRNAGDADRALACYKRVVEQMPLSASAQDAMAAIEAIYQEKGDGAGYLAYLEQIGQGGIKSGQDKERIVFGSAEQLFLGGNWERAVRSLEAFSRDYPESRLLSKADFYRGESYRRLDEKEKARDCFSRVVESADTTFAEPSMSAFAQLSYQMQLYDDAYGAYRALLQSARFEENRAAARKGLLYSAWQAKRYDSAIVAADALLDRKDADETLREDATYIKAMSLLNTSRREEAMACFRELAGKPRTARGAESTYILIKDAFDRADYTAVEDMTADFSDSGTTHVYYLAKAVLLLCDAYVERGDVRAAKDNLVWIRDSYRSSDPSDDVLSAVGERLAKIESNQ